MIQTETLTLLEWPRLCQHLSTFAATKLGVAAAQSLALPVQRQETEQLLCQTKEVYELENRLNITLQFDGIQDIRDALARADLQGILAGVDLLEVATTLAGARQLRRTIDDQEDGEVPTLLMLVEELRTYPDLEKEIYRCIDDRGRVTDRANPKLLGIREKQRTTRDQIYSKLQKMLSRNSNAVQEAVITQRDGRYVIPIKATHKDLVPGIVHDTSTTGATLYVEPQSTVGANNQMRQLLRQEQAEEEAIRRQLTEQIAAVGLDLLRLVDICTVLDFATARARYGYWLGANPPRFVDWSGANSRPVDESAPSLPTEKIVLRQLRHPLLVWQQLQEAGQAVVPIDLTIQPQIRVVAITGPNTGGKTVTLKTLGLAVLMAKVGMFVPAREPVELPWFEQVLTDIGDEQSLEQSLSTFSGHIRRIGRILEALEQTSNSLVLLDEVGAGTDPSEGSALAIALLQELADKAVLSIATTHFGELKALKYQDARFENASVEFDDVSLSPTYKLLWGIPGRSNALAIARRLGLKPDVIEQAQKYVGGKREDLNQVIAGLETQRREQAEKSAEADRLIKQAEFLYEQVSRKADKLRDQERHLKAQQEEAVQAEIGQAKSEIAKVIRTLQRGKVSGQDAQQATAKVDQLAGKYLPSQQKKAKPKPGFRPQVGDRVRIPRLGQKGEVLSIAADGDTLAVRFGLMKMTVGMDEIESLQGEKVQKPERSMPKTPVPPPAPTPLIKTSQNTIDIRGSRVMDAEVTLDQAIATGDRAIWIIHGHGTGKLRHGVHEFLKQHGRVTRFEAAAKEDGGSGVTIAHLC
ncbi:endonuclease MutS2 [filamentous cyanobacterium LEGE 11480]|uniref:Endonuclease MutS2 n=1 Tax=Romeriopsis navalis LEGE 11480 TaxID=2777977 RepID=A0A928VL87_9CYAN|nr:endonuclease MutS2 [Romeriopsis navalis]MBE9028585.1 endonuclease MutS2 [Romeriopsis navalis LEGE 11480]